MSDDQIVKVVSQGRGGYHDLGCGFTIRGWGEEVYLEEKSNFIIVKIVVTNKTSVGIRKWMS